MPDPGYIWHGHWAAAERRAVNKGARRGVTQSPVRKRRKRRSR